MTDVTIMAEGTGEPPASPTQEAVAAVEVLEAARDEGRQEGLADGLLLATVTAQGERIATLESQMAETLATLRAASELGAAQSQAIAALDARLSQEQAAHVEAVEEIIEEKPAEDTDEKEPEPVVDRTPSRKRHWA